MPRLINLSIDEINSILSYLFMDGEINDPLIIKLNLYKNKIQQEKQEEEDK